MPDLVLILAVDLGLGIMRALAPLMAFAMGYATDALSGSQLGLNAFTVTLIFLLCLRIVAPVWVTSGQRAAECWGRCWLSSSCDYRAWRGVNVKPPIRRLTSSINGFYRRRLLQATVLAVLAPTRVAIAVGSSG